MSTKPQEGDSAEHVDGEVYRFEDVDDDGATMVNLRSDARSNVLRSELDTMVDGGAWTIRTETEATVTDVDDLDEDTLYRYEHADPDDDSREFWVNLRFKDSDDFADYGEGAIQFLYRDGYVADVPVSNVETMVAAHKIVEAE